MLYKGSILKKFVIDRLAMGYSEKSIMEMFESNYNEKLSIQNIEHISEKYKDEIIDRKKELLENLEKNSVSVEARLESLYLEIKEVLDELKENKQWKQYSSVLNGLLKNVELLAKSLGKLKRMQSPESKLTLQKNNYNAILLLAEDGILSVKDRKKLKKLLGLEDDENEEGIEVVYN